MDPMYLPDVENHPATGPFADGEAIEPNDVGGHAARHGAQKALGVTGYVGGHRRTQYDTVKRPSRRRANNYTL